MRKKIFAICGSTRKESVNLHIIRSIAKMYADDYEWAVFNELDQVPHFNPDLDNGQVPNAVTNFRTAIEQADGILICTPEYVFSLPGSLKNAFEWLVSTVVLTDKPAALITASSQGTHAHAALGKLMQTLGVKFGDASLLIQAPKTKVDLAGNITDIGTVAEIRVVIDAFGKLMA